MATKKVSKAVGNARLTKLALFLLTLPEKSFYYGEWFRSKDKVAGTCADPNVCGTTACALGWAPSIPAFRKLGAGLKVIDNHDGTWRGYVTLNGRGNSEYTAVKLFGLDYHDVQFLFTPSYGGCDKTKPSEKATAKEVATHILKYVAERTRF